MKKKTVLLLLFGVLFVVLSFIGGYHIASFLKPYIFHKDNPEIAGVATEENSPTPIPLSGTLIFVSNKEGNWEIYQMNLATREVQNLTQNPANDMNPQISEDGKHLVFFSDREGSNAIYQMDRDSHDTKRLTKNGNSSYDPSYSPNGKQIVFKSNRNDKNAGNGDIFIMSTDGTNQKNLTASRKTTEEWDPSFSPDGKKIVFVSRLNAETEHESDEIFTMNTDGSGITRLTDNSVPDWYPSFNSDGSKLLFISGDTPADDDDIFVSNSDGINRKRLTSQPGDNSDPAWSTDNSKIVFINNQDGDYDLYLMDADGGNVIKIEDTKGDELSPIFVPEAPRSTPVSMVLNFLTLWSKVRSTSTAQ